MLAGLPAIIGRTPIKRHAFPAIHYLEIGKNPFYLEMKLTSHRSHRTRVGFYLAES